MIPRLAMVLAAVCLLQAEDSSPRKVQVTNTQKADLPAGGLLRLKHSRGEVNIEAWEQPGVEITTIKSTPTAIAEAGREKARKRLEQVTISVQREGDELVIGTDSPRRHGLPSDVDLEYRIKAPKDTRLAVENGGGEVHIYNLTGDVQASVGSGTITLLLPAGEAYAIDARSTFGHVNSEFPGQEKRRKWLLGHSFLESSSAPHKLNLRVGYGDIIILKAQEPAATR